MKDTQFDSYGLEHTISGYDIIVRISEDSIPEGMKFFLKLVHFRMHHFHTFLCVAGTMYTMYMYSMYPD